VRTNIVGALRAAGVDAVGLAGLDGLLEVDLVDPAALGRVGTVTAVETEELHELLAQGKTPVLAPVSRGADGGIVNVNADDAASAVAGAMGATELLLISDVPGVLDGSGVLSAVNGEDVDQLIRAGVVRDGMAAKLRAAGTAGATRVRIGNLELLRSVTAGTVVLRHGRSAA
jgi:acetylglutamate kinase